MKKLFENNGLIISDTEHSVVVHAGDTVLLEQEYQPGRIESFAGAATYCHGFTLGYDMLPWRPIADLSEKDRYGDENGFLILAPELVDGDCNVHGVGMGYWQDDRDVPCDEHGAVREDGVDYGGWLACKWSMQNDEWAEVPCTPTHYLRLRGVS
jgi:hypothetical protein